MNERAVELAQLSLDTFIEGVSPEYKQARQDLLAELAIQGARVEKERLIETQGAANYRLICGFIDLLPSTSADNKIVTNKPFEVQAVKASALWIQQYRQYRPYYIVGMNSENVCMLVLPFNKWRSKSQQLFTLALREPEKRKLIGQSSDVYKLPTPEETEKMFNMDDNQLHVSSSMNGIRKIQASSVGRAFSNSAHNRLKQKRYVLDEDMYNFKVSDYLNNIATLFGMESSLRELLSEAKVE